MAEQLLNNKNQFGIKELTLLPDRGGMFEVTVNGDLVFSKLSLERFPEPDEVLNLVREKYETSTPSTGASQ